ncbi:MAG TPA: MarR family winged helix-turn-helix transcriptional regulator, partial [Acidimicrobiales bacterium]|nr:MarR family winged helix-turn-helix transcriptional regulator [Acidimicrobiales bacterium]
MTSLGPGDSIGRVLALSAKAMREWFEARLAERGGSLPIWIVLSQALDAPISLSQRELAARVGIGGATLVRHLDRLEAEGLVVRRRDDRDRRVTRVEITPAGRDRFVELAVVADDVDRELAALMSDEEQETLRRLLLRIGEYTATAPRPAIPMATPSSPGPSP